MGGSTLVVTSGRLYFRLVGIYYQISLSRKVIYSKAACVPSLVYATEKYAHWYDNCCGSYFLFPLQIFMNTKKMQFTDFT